MTFKAPARVSPLVGQLVETEGIVTARRLNTARDAENGFFLQAVVDRRGSGIV